MALVGTEDKPGQKPCPTCNNTGKASWEINRPGQANLKSCPRCGGTGWITENS